MPNYRSHKLESMKSARFLLRLANHRPIKAKTYSGEWRQLVAFGPDGNSVIGWPVGTRTDKGIKTYKADEEQYIEWLRHAI